MTVASNQFLLLHTHSVVIWGKKNIEKFGVKKNMDIFVKNTMKNKATPYILHMYVCYLVGSLIKQQKE